MEGVEGLARQVPQVMACKGSMTRLTPPSTRLQHLVDSKVLLKKKRRSNTAGFPSLGRGTGLGPPKKLVLLRYNLPEPKGDRVLRDLLLEMS